MSTSAFSRLAGHCISDKTAILMWLSRHVLSKLDSNLNVGEEKGYIYTTSMMMYMIFKVLSVTHS